MVSVTPRPRGTEPADDRGAHPSETEERFRLVEDEEELREMMREALELNGYAVATAQEGQEALEAIAGIEHVCLVLLDLLMPGMNGWDFFMKLRQRPELAHVPVVVHSSAADRAPAGVTRVLKKPVELDRLLSIIQEYCPKPA